MKKINYNQIKRKEIIGVKERMYEKSVAYYLFSILENLDRIDAILEKIIIKQ